MWKSIDCKSLVIGGLLVLLVLGAVGAVPWLSDNSFGRFTIETNSGYAFVLDSATGQVWSLYTGAHGGMVARPRDPEEFFARKLEWRTHDPDIPVE